MKGIVLAGGSGTRRAVLRDRGGAWLGSFTSGEYEKYHEKMYSGR